MEPKVEQNSSISSFRVMRAPLVIATAFLVAELAFRLVNFGPHSMLNWKRYNPQGILTSELVEAADHPDISWKLRPNVNEIYKARPFSTNGLGLRGSEISVKKDSSVKRIAILGRSLTMGSGVGDGEDYPNVLAGMLAEWKPGTYEVLNCAVGGYSPKQIITHYEEYISELDPDIIFFMFSKKDLSRNKLQGIPPLADAQPELTNLNFYLSHAFLYESSRLIVKKFTNSFISTDWNERANEVREAVSDSVSNATLLADFFQRRNQEEIDCYVFMPKRGKVDPGEGPESIARWAEDQSGVTYLDINDHLKAAKPENLHIYFGDTHPSADMHRVYAEAIFKKFVSGEVN